LEPPCPKSVDGISIDPEPNWNFESLVAEIASVEKKLNGFSMYPQPITNTTLRYIYIYVYFILEFCIELGPITMASEIFVLICLVLVFIGMLKGWEGEVEDL